nr:ClbS/DfsB family four-helix bundle protein [Marinicella sp. W31]MDC2875841.1 ClbS/DfsB family four-helix bundle protein [Marinicella sp. W31]
MPAAKNKSELLTAFDKDLAKLRKTLAVVGEETSALSSPDDATTIKGIIAHRTHWMGMLHRWYEDGVAGRRVFVPAEGYKWNQLKAYNAPIYLEGNNTPWAELLLNFENASETLRTFIVSQDNHELYTHGAHAWTGKWTLGRYIEASGPSHFRSANSYIRKILRTAR